MKFFLLSLFAVLVAAAAFAQSSGPNNPAAAVCVPNSSCLGCPGSVWNNTTNVFLQDNSVASVGLTMNGQCFQSTCYYSRFLYSSNFGFAIPGTATILGIKTEIYRQSGNAASAADSSIRLVKGGIPQGMNKANPNPWSTTAAYYPYGSATDTWGISWLPSDINASNFGMYLRVFNMSSSATTPTVDHIRITVYYSTSTGIFSQTSTPSSLNVYQNEDQLEVLFVSDQQIAKGTLKIFNMLGEMQMKKELTTIPAGSNSEKFAVGNLSAGIYFVQFDNGAGIQTKKVLIHN